PWIHDVAVFIDNFSVEDESTGMRKLPLSSSPEIHDNSPQAWFSQTTNFDLGLIGFTLEKAAELAKELGLDDEAEQWEGRLALWPDLAFDESGLNFAPGHPYEASHRHFSHLVAWHPLGVVDVSMGDHEKQLINNTLQTLEEFGPDWWVGYSYSWFGNLYARAFDGEKAAQALRDFANCFCLPNSFHVNGDQTKSGMSRFQYRPFTLEGNFAFASGIQEMLLQSHTDVIRIFPAIPKDWSDISFSSFRTEGGYLVSAELANGELSEVLIKATVDGLLKISLGSSDKFIEKEMSKGDEIKLYLSDFKVSGIEK
ncbi:MAG: hypothetical protein HOC82_19135, partial [Bacteroidetes bacterium]|nr:hypothetical protein [Bacteroidota bacterium]